MSSTINKSEHNKRVITAILGVSLVFSLYYLFRHIGVLVITAVISLATYYEFLVLILNKSSSSAILKAKLWSGLAVAVVMMAVFTWKQEWNLIPLYFAFLIFLLLALFFSHITSGSDTHRTLRTHLKDTMAQSFGLFYITGFLSFVPNIHSLPQGPKFLLMLLLIIWGGDIGAYYGGKLLGQHKLSPNISPGKTWEGSAMGTLFCLLLCLVLQHFLLPMVNLWLLLIVTFLTSIIAQAGDLLESLVKRAVNAKDSGTLFPGHGGAFDRFDSLILAAPFYYFLILQFGIVRS